METGAVKDDIGPEGVAAADNGGVEAALGTGDIERVGEDVERVSSKWSTGWPAWARVIYSKSRASLDKGGGGQLTESMTD